MEFTRNLAESVKTGTPIGQSIINMKSKNLGTLSPHIKKLANQISLGIPISKAFGTFAGDLDSNTIKRAVALIREAESAGGQIDNILDSVAKSIYEIEKLKKERIIGLLDCSQTYKIKSHSWGLTENLEIYRMLDFHF